MTWQRMGTEISNLPGRPDAVFAEFLKKLSTGLETYRTGGEESWARFIDDYLLALVSPYYIQREEELKNDIYVNLAASLITYVSLATSPGWIVTDTPAATCGVLANCGSHDEFIHVIAMKVFNDGKQVVGLFHTEAQLTQGDLAEDLSGDLLGRIERLSDAIQGQLGAAWRGLDPSIFIVAFSIDSNQTPLDLKAKLENLLAQGKLNVPVYVVYVDKSGYVRGYCVGPTGTCSDEVLNQTAIDVFGVGLNQLDPNFGQPPEQPPPVDEPIITSPLCSSVGQCIVP